MPFDSENQFVPADPSDWARIRALPRIVVHPKSPLPDGIADWIVPGKTSDDGPDDWIAPGNARADTFPDDWFVPPPSAAPSIGQPVPSPQPNAGSAGFSNAPVGPPSPFADYWSLIQASRVGAMAWDPPNLPLFRPSPTTNFPAPPTPLSGPPIPLGSRPALGLDSSLLSSTHSLPSPAIPEGGLLGQLATLGSPPPPWAIPEGGLLGGLAALGLPSSSPAIPSEGGLLGALAKLGPPSLSTPTSSLADGSFPAAVPSAFSQPSLSRLVVPVSDQATRPGWIPLGPGSGWEPWADQFIKGMQGLINHFRSRSGGGAPRGGDGEDCYDRWEREDARCKQFLPFQDKRYFGACKDRASARRDLCIRNGGRPHPAEPREYDWRDIP